MNNGIEFTAGEGGTQLFAGLQLSVPYCMHMYTIYSFIISEHKGREIFVTAFVLSSSAVYSDLQYLYCIGICISAILCCAMWC